MSAAHKGKKATAARKAEELPDEPPLDPAIQSVQSGLEANLTFFISNIGAIIKRYDEALEKAVPPAAATPTLAAAAPEAPAAAAKVEATATTDEQPASPQGAAASSSSTTVIELELPDNTELLKQLSLLKREAYELSTTFDGIHDWIALNIPDMKGDESSGVQVMGAVIEQLQSLNEAVRGAYAMESKYLGERADLEQALIKVPDSETLMLSLEVTDSDTWDDVERGWRTLIRVCLIAYNVLAKNMNKLRDPKGNASRANGMVYM